MVALGRWAPATHMDSPLSRSPGRKELSEDCWPGPPWSSGTGPEDWGAAHSPPPAPGKDQRWDAPEEEEEVGGAELEGTEPQGPVS